MIQNLLLYLTIYIKTNILACMIKKNEVVERSNNKNCFMKNTSYVKMERGVKFYEKKLVMF